MTPTADYTGDGVVDAEDYTAWRDTLGATVTAGTGADGDGSGVIDIGDYNLWVTEFGQVAGPTGTGTLTTGFVRYVTSGSLESANVPEPSTVVLVSLGLTGLLTATRKWN